MTIVLDANIFISFLLTKNPTISFIINLWYEEKITLIITDEIITEITQVIERFIINKIINSDDGYAFLERLKEDSHKITSFSKVNLSKDQEDNRYLSCALDSQADYLVTGDKKHLLILKKIGNTQIVSPKDFIGLYQKEDILDLASSYKPKKKKSLPKARQQFEKREF